MPADAQLLFVQLFDFAAQNPSMATIKPVYQLLNGSASHLLGILSNQVLVKLEDQIFELLRTIKGDTTPLSLYCLAILRVMLAASDEDFRFSVSSYDTQELLASTQLTASHWTPDAVKQFFYESKAQRTMQLLALRAMWACAASSVELLDERLESIKLANEIISAVPSDIRETWRKSNAMLVRKLEEKIQTSTLDAQLRFQSLCFLLHLNEGGFSPALAIDGLRQILSRPTALLEVRPQEDFPTLLRLCNSCGIFDHTTLTNLVQNVVDFLTTAKSESIVALGRPLQQLLTQLSDSLVRDDALTEGIMLALDVLSCGDKLLHLRANVNNVREESYLSTTAMMCNHTVQSHFNELAHGLSRLLLAASLSSRQSSYSPSTQTQIMLLDLYAASAQTLQPCRHAGRNALQTYAPISFAEATSTPDEAQLNWRQALDLQAQKHAHFECASISALFQTAVAELEQRCDTAEAPLREKERQYLELQSKYNDLNDAYANLENEGIDRDIRSDALERERDQFANELESTKEGMERLQQTTSHLENELIDQRSRSNDALKDAQEARENVQMQHAAALALKEETISNTKDELYAVSANLKEKSKQLENAREELLSVKTELEDLVNAKERLEHDHREQSANLHDISNELETMQIDKKNLEEEIQRIQAEFELAKAKHQDELEASKEQAKLGIENAEADRMAALMTADAEAQRLRDELSTYLTETEDLRTVQEQQSARLHRRDRKVHDLQKEVCSVTIIM
jgi:uncharacterized protein YsxB (DUF464 family)